MSRADGLRAPFLGGRIVEIEHVLSDTLIADPTLHAGKRFSALRWLYGAVRLLGGNERDACRAELLRARRSGHVPRRDRRYEGIAELSWVLEDKVLMQGAR